VANEETIETENRKEPDVTVTADEIEAMNTETTTPESATAEPGKKQKVTLNYSRNLMKREKNQPERLLTPEEVALLNEELKKYKILGV